jgi:hypothetical protein
MLAENAMYVQIPPALAVTRHLLANFGREVSSYAMSIIECHSSKKCH